MRVGVAFAGGAMGGPSGMGDAHIAARRLPLDGLLQGAHLAHGPQASQAAGAVQDGEAGRIVSPVFQAPQSLHQDGDDVPLGNCPDDSAHVKGSSLAMWWFAFAKLARRATRSDQWVRSSGLR